MFLTIPHETRNLSMLISSYSSPEVVGLSLLMVKSLRSRARNGTMPLDALICCSSERKLPKFRSGLHKSFNFLNNSRSPTSIAFHVLLSFLMIVEFSARTIW
ncbi:hypothetical protein OGAPHI_007428 [Ogataea philodendri]|uniref:Uncharacterized protein n=1 Tax=Ogataea philodendri TaxID=1378263 RepID=A0A9P8NUQ0_9ASCO|nr:uncharacterized protein OGAPHI_007428 [Ogataea philodendri]KAH3660223.1 hypothetical protein OGAPHI_007428 [Ogataea philodendri]